MAKKKGRRKKRTDSRVTPLEGHVRDKKHLRPPLTTLGNFQFSSWVNGVLPNVLWSVLIASLLPREKAIATFRVVLTLYKRHRTALGDIMLEHSQFAQLTAEQFDSLFAELCKDEGLKKALLPLLLLESLPDAVHWRRCLAAAVDPAAEGKSLMQAVGDCFDHQSQAATDCRWVRVMTLLAQEKMKFPKEMEERVLELIQYPDRGDMRSVRPFIRATEMTTRTMSENEKPAAPVYSEEFWSECFAKTPCIPWSPDNDVTIEKYDELFENVMKLYSELSDYFLATMTTTAVDPRHDGAFGIVLFILQLVVLALNGATGQTIVGRFVVRSALEAYINLSFLTHKDDPTIWLQYRNYGVGQTKLMYLKNLSVEDLPSFTTRELLEALVNEDQWLEFQDIKLGAWADKNLRKMAEETGVKDVYDRYYDGLSGYVHANWSAVRHAVYGTCLNPLHRFHRIPVEPRFLSQDAVPDLIKIANMALDRISALYPPFKGRLHIPERPAAEAQVNKMPSEDAEAPA